mmetsp:Transcript_26328/g.31076  ORF Transcript_26328/g.31076 Transcript_26328/m.31076 type:complete len:89 (+) Transcript_26328:1782-2048(+)
MNRSLQKDRRLQMIRVLQKEKEIRLKAEEKDQFPLQLVHILSGESTGGDPREGTNESSSGSNGASNGRKGALNDSKMSIGGCSDYSIH